MKNTALILLGGLAFAGAAVAGEPVPQTDIGTSSSLKIGIDAKTGKRRQLTAEESAALDAQAAKQRTNKAPNLRAKGVATLPTPATFEESAANGVTRNGITMYVAPLESFHNITITRDSAGKVTYSENGEPTNHAQELDSE